MKISVIHYSDRMKGGRNDIIIPSDAEKGFEKSKWQKHSTNLEYKELPQHDK